MKSIFSASNSESLTGEIAALAGASRADLTSRWRVLYETEPPRRISRELLKRALAYPPPRLHPGDPPPAGQGRRRCIGTTSDRALVRADPGARYSAAAQLAWHRAPG